MLSRSLSMVAMLVLLAFAACGGDREVGSTVATAPRGPAVATIEVKEAEYRLAPQDPEVEKAGVVDLYVTNAGEIGHALEVEGPSGEVETEEIAPGDSATLKADLGEPGRYKWYCPIADHEDRGMVGEIVVAGGG